MAETAFAPPRSSYPELLKMIHAYFLADRKAKGEPVGINDVAGHAAMNPTVISRNNAFFSSVGLIEGGKKKRLTELGRALGLAVSHKDESRIADALQRIIESSDFLSRLLNAVSIRSGMDWDALQTHIAISAGVQRTAQTMAGSNAIIRLLLASGRLVDDGGTLRTAPASVAKDDVAEAPQEPRRSTINIGRTTVDPKWWSLATLGTDWTYAGARPAGITLNLNINVEAKDAEAVRAILQELLGYSPPTSKAQDDE
jgi:hypothetical protein